MNAQDKVQDRIERDEEKLVDLEHAEAAIETKTSHDGFRDAQLLLKLTDEASRLDSELVHEKERQANDRK